MLNAPNLSANSTIPRQQVVIKNIVFPPGRKRKTSQNSQDLCVWGENPTPAKLTKIWPVFDSGGFGASILDLNTRKKTPILKNPLLYTDDDSYLFKLSDGPFKTDCFGGLHAAWQQTRISNKISHDDVTKKIFSSVSKQLRIINTHMLNSMYRYKYPRVTRTNVLLDSSSMRRPATHFSLTMRALRFQSTPGRELPCYGNLELPFKIKQENATAPQFYPALCKGVKTEDKMTDVMTDVKVKIESDRKEKEKEKEREKDKERDKDR